MDLTPIKVRGRKRNHPARLHAEKIEAQQAKAASSQASSSAKRRKNSKPKKVTTPAMPTLQGLPQELLEMVFLYSMNIALPQCSLTLGRRLSSQTVMMDFTMRCFFHTVDHKANIRDRKITSDPYMQSRLLECKFFTWDFFLAYVQKSHDAMVKQRGKAWESTTVTIPGVSEFDGLWPFKFTRIPYLGFAAEFVIPEKLLHGPWTKDKVSLLYVLVSLNGEIDWTGLAGETAKSGIREAIKEDDERAVAALSVLLGVPKAINTSILQYAVIECDCSVNILRHLLFNAQILARNTTTETLDFHDPKLWAWSEANGEKGEVLKTMLKKADAFDLEFYFEEDADWTKIVGFPYGGTKFDARATFDELVRELLMNLYQNYGRKITRRRRWIADESVEI
jgi:hypothetical protein